MEKSNFPIILV